MTPAACHPTPPRARPSDSSGEEGDLQKGMGSPGPTSALLDSAASIFGTSSSLNQDLHGRAGQLREERNKLWTSVADPQEMDK